MSYVCICVCADRFTASLSPKSVGMQDQVADLKIKMMESANRGHEGCNEKAKMELIKIESNGIVKLG